MVANRLFVHLADNEWGNDKMWEIAKSYFNSPEYAGIKDLVITIYEHAGWVLSYLRDGTIVGTANDLANLSKAAKAFVNNVTGYAVIGAIRR